MKIFRFFFGNKSDNTTLKVSGSVVCIPDSALLILKQPFFIPDFTHECTAQPCVALSINRLGRSINEKFAHRYYDIEQITLGIHFVARDLLTQFKQNGLPWSDAVGFDNSVAIANKIDGGICSANSIKLKLDDKEDSLPIDQERIISQFDQLIARISQFYTLRQGDILLLPLSVEEIPIHINQHIRLLVNDDVICEFNIK